MENIQINTYFLFVFTTILTVFLFWKATHFHKKTILILSSWMVLQGILSVNLFYTQWDALPPRFMFFILPPILFSISMFVLPAGKLYIQGLDLKTLTYLHTIRIPVEIVLFQLSLAKVVSPYMTFEGTNFDILSGLSAPIIYYFACHRIIKPKILIVWNILCLILLFNIVVTAILSAKTPIQILSFEQPNIAVAYFPFAFLPSVIVPIVFFSHFASLYLLFTKNE